MNTARPLSLDTQALTPADHTEALALALDTLEAVHQTVEASGDQRVALALKALLEDLAEQHLERLFETTGAKIYDAQSPGDMAELRALEPDLADALAAGPHSREPQVNALGGEA